MIGLVMGHTPPLTVVEQSKVHAYLLLISGVERTR